VNDVRFDNYDIYKNDERDAEMPMMSFKLLCYYNAKNQC